MCCITGPIVSQLTMRKMSINFATQHEIIWTSLVRDMNNLPICAYFINDSIMLEFQKEQTIYLSEVAPGYIYDLQMTDT